MALNLDRCFRFLCAAQAGGQLFFAAVAAQVVFPKDVAALPHGHERRTLAADLVGQMLLRLDAATLLVAAVAVLLAFLAKNEAAPTRAALFPLLAGLCAVASMAGTTPAIQSLRAAGRTGEPLFGLLHAASSLLLVAEMLLFAWAALRANGASPELRAALDAAPRAG